ncbi:MAG: RtcB family protein [Proteobacteria bacterium]|jgi:tRNA-splicing ligase RtcB|nr:RtcB family protein [Pseudomonadota bacterium]
MNGKQLVKLGCPEDCARLAVDAIRVAREGGDDRNIKAIMKTFFTNPQEYVGDKHFGDLANLLIQEQQFVRSAAIPYKVWGSLEEGCDGQMQQACSLPMAVTAAVMPDCHVGYGLPIGGVLALQGAVCPNAVGVDIACRMSLSILDMPVNSLEKKFNLYREAIAKSTRFGIGDGGNAVFDQPKNHPVMDEDWGITRVTKQQKDKAWKQLGTSGSGNHFIDVGILQIQNSPSLADIAGLLPGEYVAIMTHSGSRGPGAAVCQMYHGVAQSKLPKKYDDLKNLAWLDLASNDGQEYWLAMQLMGRFAQANHQLIHKAMAQNLGAKVLFNVENHHNFAFLETHDPNQGEVVVHRKGATPASHRMLGVIPGSMGTPAYIVVGKGNPASLCSASHGAGRLMSRKKAKEKYVWKAVQGNLDRQGVIVLDATADESPGVYKDIDTVMAAQSDLVEIVATFNPKIVKMCGDNSPSED